MVRKPNSTGTSTCKREGGDKSMASFSCKNLGMDCSFEATGTTESELMKKFAEHAEPAHDMNVLSADIIYKFQKAIKK
jgi:predicted small metal-binding protein